MRQKAYSYLQQKIQSGELAPGTLISEASLARELGSSRTPLREAIGQLVAEGLLRQTPNRGSVVAEFTRRDIAELYELREALEVYAVGKAAESDLRAADLHRLQESLREILDLRDELKRSRQNGLSPEQMELFVAADMKFHATIVRAGANRRILKALLDTRVLLNVFSLRRKGHDVALLTEIHRYHNEVLDAVCSHKPELAARLLREHIRVSMEERLRDYEDWEHERALAQAR
jgi:DNA-binding GntR family transcriptional regulator